MKLPMRFYQGFGMGGGGYTQAAGLVGMLGTDIWGMAQGSDLFGSKPKVAMFKPINLQTEQGKAIGSNLAELPQIGKLGAAYQQLMSQQINQLLPGYSDAMKSGAADFETALTQAGSLLHGQIPQDVVDQIRRNTAYESFQGGFAGSDMSRNLTARDLGLTSLNLISQGANLAAMGGSAAQNWTNLARGEMMNPGDFFVTPSQQASWDLQNRLLHLQTLQEKYNVAAQPNPQTVGEYGLISSRFGQLAGMGGSGGGGGLASIGGGGAGMMPGIGGGGSGGISAAEIQQIIGALQQSGGSGGSSYYGPSSDNYFYDPGMA